MSGAAGTAREMRLTLFDTALAPAAPKSMATRGLRAYLLGQPAVAERWEIETLTTVTTVNTFRFDERTSDAVLAAEPDVLGLSAYCWDLDAHLDLAARIKTERPEARIVIGGPAASSLPADFLDRTSAVDVVVRGEGERALARLLDRSWRDLSGIGAISWRGPDGRTRHEDGGADHEVLEFDELPSAFAGGSHLPFSERNYVGGPRHAPPLCITFEFSRGCRNRCKFCAWSPGGSTLRRAAVERMEAEIAWAKRNHYPHIFLVDSAVNQTPEHLANLRRASEAADPTGSISFTFMVDHRRLDEAQVAELARLPIGRQEFGLNTTNPRAARAASRGTLSLSDFERKLEMATAAGPITLHLMLGMPGDDLAGYRRTLADTAGLIARVGREHIALVRVCWMVVPPGTSTWNEREALGIRLRERSTPYVLSSGGFSTQELLTALGDTFDSDFGDLCVVDGPIELFETMRAATSLRLDNGFLSMRGGDGRGGARVPEIGAGEPPPAVRALARRLPDGWRSPDGHVVADTGSSGASWWAEFAMKGDARPLRVVLRGPNGEHAEYARIGECALSWSDQGREDAELGNRERRLLDDVVRQLRGEEPGEAVTADQLLSVIAPLRSGFRSRHGWEVLGVGDSVRGAYVELTSPSGGAPLRIEVRPRSEEENAYATTPRWAVRWRDDGSRGGALSRREQALVDAITALVEGRARPRRVRPE